MRIGQFCVAGRSSVDKTTFGKGLAWISIAARNPQHVQVSLANPEIVVVKRVGIRAQRNVILGTSLQARLRLNHPQVCLLQVNTILGARLSSYLVLPFLCFGCCNL